MMARLLTLLLVVVSLAAPACTAKEWTVALWTNMPAPQFGDRVYVEVLDADGNIACDDCARQFGPLTDSDFPLTFGIVKTSSTVRLRARFYRSTIAGPDGLPRGSSLVDVLATLPPTEGGGNKVATFFLPSFCFGTPPNVTARTSCSAEHTNEPGPEPVLSLFSAPLTPTLTNFRKPCTQTPPAGMSCVGSAAFLIGDERAAVASDFPTRPVQNRAFLTPIALDTDEMTVGKVRKLVGQRVVSGARGFTRRGAAGTGFEDCTYENDGSNDALPMNCVTREFAQSVCMALDRRLPTESEWEYAAGNGAAETHYPWGEPQTQGAIYESTQTLCARAVVGRGRSGTSQSTACGSAMGPIAGGNDLDVTSAGIRNLGGNLSEWVAGELALYTEPCWAEAQALEFNSPCEIASTILTDALPFLPYRGGSWSRPPESSAAVNRFAAKGDDFVSPSIGFRCAWNETLVP